MAATLAVLPAREPDASDRDASRCRALPSSCTRASARSRPPATPLIEAVKSGNTAAVRTLARNARGERGRGRRHRRRCTGPRAPTPGNRADAARAPARRPTRRTATASRPWRSPRSTAARAIVEALLEAGADANTAWRRRRDGADGRRAHGASRTPCGLLLDRGRRRQCARAWHGETALMWAAGRESCRRWSAARAARRRSRRALDSAGVPQGQGRLRRRWCSRRCRVAD